MSPLAWDQLNQNLAKEESVKTIQDCYSQAKATSLGAFLAGFSGGIATQAQFHASLPKIVKAFLIVPIACGLSLALPVHRYMKRDCVARFQQAAETCASCSEEDQKLPVSN